VSPDETWSRALAIFQDLADLAPAERDLRLAAACAGDEALRRRVADLLAADSGTGSPLDRSAARRFASLLEDREAPLDRWIGRQLGPYRVVRELGRGGMGAVFLGERCDGQFEQRVALKVARLGLAGDEAVRRFLAERRILAGLEHPHIARLLDGGVTAEGLPFFAMEYVEGVPIGDYCDSRDLSLSRRIELFLGVCAAVDHAHRRLVVHRDLKPSNILVTASGDVKLLDFGIAKLLGDDDEGTRTLERHLTPAYAAPEQIRGKRVTTATDVWALGVVLYELLVGRRPFSTREAREEVALAMAGDEAVRPSTAVATGKLPTPSRRRRRRALRGDLDTILLTALREEPDRRYPSAAALAEDLRRHLSFLPIRARPDSAGYRAGKFAARHRWTLAIAATLLLALVGALAAALGQARAKAREARASQEVTAFLVRLFEGSDPTLARGGSLTAQELLDEGVARLRSDLAGEPEVRARLLHAMGASYVALGLYGRALPLAEEALRLRRQTLPAKSPEVAESMDQLGEIFRLEADFVGAEPLLRDALAARRARLGPDDPAVIQSLGHVGRLYEDEGLFARAEAPFRKALNASERRFGPDSPETAGRLDDFATNQSDLGREAKAIGLLRRALAIRERALGPDALGVAASLQSLGLHLDGSGAYPESAAALERALAIRRKVLGPAHPLVGATQIALAGVYDDEDRHDDAEKTAESALAILRRTLPEDHPKIGEALNMLGIIRSSRRDFAGAVPVFRELLARYQRVSGKGHPDTLSVENNLAVTLLHAGRASEAESLERDVLVQLGEDNGQVTGAFARENLATTLEQEGRPREALGLARQALELQRRREGESSGNVAVAMRSVAVAEEMCGEAGPAERDFREGLRLGEGPTSSRSNVTYEWRIPLADLLVGQGRCSEAEPLLAGALAEIDRAHRPVDPIWRLQARLLQAHCTRPSGARADAARAVRAALHLMPAVEVDLYPTARTLLSARGTPRAPR
jgi:tetratricopeptide (TPR) repeat protein/predicted Ser/Thr protein kinase